MKKTFLALPLLFILTASIFAKSNDPVDYIETAKTGSVENIKDAFRKNRKLPDQVFGDNRETFLMLCLENNRGYNIIKLCIDYESDTRATAKDKRTPLMFAAQYTSDIKVIEEIAKADTLFKSGRKKKVLAKDSQGKCSFEYAAMNSNRNIYKKLLEYADDPNAEANAPAENTGIDPELLAAQQAAAEFEANAQAEKAAEDAALLTAAQTQETETAAEITTETAPAPVTEAEIPSTEAQTPDPVAEAEAVTEPVAETPAIAAVPPVTEAEPVKAENTEITEKKEPQVEVEKPVVKPLADPKKAEIKQYTQTFLMDYAEEDEVEETKAFNSDLIKNPDAADKYGVTLLMKAAKTGNDWDVRKLIESGADVNRRDRDGWSALMYACRYQNNLNIVKMLIDKGAHVRVRNKYNATPLLMAADYSQNPEIIALLLKNRSASEAEVFRAFIFAITGNSGNDHIRLAKIKLFTEMGLPLNRLWKGQTPLMYAAQYATSTQVLQILLDSGARTDIMDDSGKTAFDYAKSNKNLAHDDTYWALNSSSKKSK
ncbi:MAG: ankyrin repeat domain-containing protein [Treponema sp.]|nr:ankyrin repeat domain-containing protein [Treponema sp.]